MTESSNTQTWKVTLLTPLHLGDGIKLQANVDYISRNRTIDVIDFDGLAEQLADTPQAINDLSKNIRLDQVIRDYSLSVQPMYTMKCTSAAIPKEIRSFLKNAYGEPYLAGSSLKGAIHTALWTGLDQTNLPSPKAASESDYKKGFKKSAENLGGRDPYHMFIRPLQISDSNGIAPQTAIACEEIKFFNLQQGDQPGWKDFGGRNTKNDFRQTTGMHVETLRTNTILILQAHIDPLLAKDTIRHAAGITRSEDVADFKRMAARIGKHSRRIAERERAFFDRYTPDTRDVVRFYENLINQMDETAKKAGAFIIRLAWGSGWRGMTGDWIADEDMAFMRENGYVKLGKAGVNVFPKTRRLAIDPKTGTPSLPLGWVLVEPVEAEAFRLKPVSSVQQAVTVTGATAATAQIAPPPSQPEPPAPVDPEAQHQEQLARFQQRIQRATAFQSEVESLVKAVQQTTDKRLQREMAAMLMEKAKSLPNKAYATARKNDKRWAKMIDDLIREVS
ncbi:RAMP superfamily CRISPR-associated protein [Desulfatirhabdium butyrativorans]|uniref:RAMP superfamily CRISPR-associated protein n=1 Tax=Desulfatirhabdium butyrativorans TaxID=340467 RepID=UPI0003FC38FA|nr:RAMP superfamily CRISPR-associated protein [Desulfatirhabdium butyrativorans]